MLPDWLTQKLATPPDAGAGIHAWLFSVARQLHVHMPPEAIMAVLQAATANAGRPVPLREIRDAVQNSQAVSWQPPSKLSSAVNPTGPHSPRSRSARTERQDGSSNDGSRAGTSSPDRWPRADAYARRARVRETAEMGVGGLADLWERSLWRGEMTADDWLDLLFPGAEWLCLAVDHPATARSRAREKWSFGPAEECGLVVPSPMTGPSGKRQDGQRSHRCLDNTGPRRWLVIEFDKLEDGKTPMPIDEQAALHWHFRASAEAADWPRLALVVHSGGKSLHGWYGLCGEEERSRELMAYAVSLGADAATWNRCQLVRMPGGRRKGEPLEVFFFDPSLCLPPTTTKTILGPLHGCANLSETDSSRPAMSMNAA